MKKPFNLEKALAGDAVINGYGDAITITVLKIIPPHGRSILSQSQDGRVFAYHSNDGKAAIQDYSLFMASKTVTGWVNIYPATAIHTSQESADASASRNRIGPALKFTYEE